ncbi:AraC family transcriptional regulator [bacterium]|nr:AraC family transcriptional regulator [bacterium]
MKQRQTATHAARTAASSPRLRSPVAGDIEQYLIGAIPDARLPVDAGHAGYSEWGPKDAYERNCRASFSLELTLSGEGVMDINGGRHVVAAGDLVIMHPWDYCAYRAGPGGFWRKVYVSCHPSGIEQIVRYLRLDGVSRLHLPPARLREARRVFGQILRCARTRPRGHREAISALVYRVLVIAARETARPADTHSYPGQVRRAMAWAEAHRHEPVRVTALARAAGCSLPYFSRLFSSAVGITAHEWVLRMKMEAARMLLTTTAMRIHEVAAATGFDDQMHFSRVFRRSTGVPPRAFRARRRKGGSAAHGQQHMR